MKYDYLDILLQNGFRLPKDESLFDYDLYIEQKDKRLIELRSIIKHNFHDMQFKGYQGGYLIFQTQEHQICKILINDSEIKVIMDITDIKNNLSNNYNFYIRIDEAGSIIFKQLICNSESIILKSYVIERPNYNQDSYFIVNGYNNITLELFREFLNSFSNNINNNFIDVFEQFLSVSGITADIARKIVLRNSSSGLSQISKNIIESDISEGKEQEIKRTPIDTNYPIIHPILESYIRARDFSNVTKQANGLSVSFEDDIKHKLSKKIFYV